MKDNKKKPEENQLVWWIFLILIILGFLWGFGLFDGNDDYDRCIDDCVFDMEFCPNYIYGNEICSTYRGSYLDKYVGKGNFDSCINDLERCISDCQ